VRLTGDELAVALAERIMERIRTAIQSLDQVNAAPAVGDAAASVVHDATYQAARRRE